MSAGDDVPDEATQAPLLRVITPGATAEEVAALVAVVASLGSGEAPAPEPRPVWSAPERMHRTPAHAGPGGWRASGLPR